MTVPQYRRAVGDLRCDDAKARSELGYRHTALPAMLAETIAWLGVEGLLPVQDPSAPVPDPPVEVADEPDHVERFRNDRVGAYLAAIRPGSATLRHRYRVDTLYAVVAGGRIRLEESRGTRRQRTSLGRSVLLPVVARLAAGRIRRGWLDLPAGTRRPDRPGPGWAAGRRRAW